MAIALDRPAARAATRAGGAGLGLGLCGLAAVSFVLVRLTETWRVTPHASSHHITLLGARIGYPAANAGAIVILALALPAVVASVGAFTLCLREAFIAHRLRRTLTDTSREHSELRARIIDDPRPLAFCAGLIRPGVYVSTGALSNLDGAALRAVLEHERHHARRRDPLRLATGRVLSGALFFVPGIRRLHHDQATLAELGADEAAITLNAESRSALARAILAFADAPECPTVVDPRRIDHLLAGPETSAWRLPAALCVAGAALIALLTGVAILAGRVAAGTATLAPPFLSRQPCVLTLAALSATAVLVAAYLRPRSRAALPSIALPRRARVDRAPPSGRRAALSRRGSSATSRSSS